jgi:hypothetical protein
VRSIGGDSSALGRKYLFNYQQVWHLRSFYSDILFTIVCKQLRNILSCAMQARIGNDDFWHRQTAANSFQQTNLLMLLPLNNLSQEGRRQVWLMPV